MTPSKTTVVVRLHGAVRAGGIGLVAAADVVIADEDAQFALTEVKLGIIPAVISPYVIAAIGERKARRYMLTAERFSAAEADQLVELLGRLPGAEEDASSCPGAAPAG